MPNPFTVGPPVRGRELCGRAVELERIGATVRSAGVAAVSGPPGTGLTSLALALGDRLARRGPPVVRLDVAEAEDAEEAGELLERAGGRLGAGDPGRPHLLLDGLRREAGREAAASLLRRTAGRRAGTLLLGSPRILSELAAEEGAAGGQEGPRLTVALSPPPAAAWLPYVLERFLETDRWIGNDHVHRVLEVTGGVPRPTQAVLHALWDDTEAGGRVDDGAVDRALRAAVDREAAGFRKLLDGLTPNQRRVLRGLARLPDAAPYSGRFVADQGLASPSSVQRALQALEDRGLVARDGADRPRVASPLMGRWLVRRAAEAAHAWE